MTTKQREAMHARNEAICAFYQNVDPKTGESNPRPMADVGRKFGLKRQRVQQILKKAGIWRPHERSGRTKFVGVVVREETKEALERLAEEKGTSVSKLTSDALDDLVKEEKE